MISLLFLVSCGWADGPDADVDRLVAAELAAPINSVLPPEQLTGFSRWWREKTLHRWLNNHPDARKQVDALEDYLRAHTDAKTEAAWKIVQEDSRDHGPVRAEVQATPWRLVVVVDRSYSTAPGRKEAVDEVKAVMEQAQIPTVAVVGTGTARVEVLRNGQVVAQLAAENVPEPTGWLIAEEGKEAVWIPQDAATTVLWDMSDYFRTRLGNPTDPP